MTEINFKTGYKVSYKHTSTVGEIVFVDNNFYKVKFVDKFGNNYYMVLERKEISLVCID